MTEQELLERERLAEAKEKNAEKANVVANDLLNLYSRAETIEDVFQKLARRMPAEEKITKAQRDKWTMALLAVFDAFYEIVG